ncbi:MULTISPECIES: acylphosphatase [Sinorhizobium]|uniref:Acylphosphatase n=3 Tax=Sinorhizobium TaxID=28105 RepID=A0A2S3YQZ2_9HYPH|nr:MULTISPECIES: acylphosphatase [Sinorhizobium]PDT35527.1 acylphosphatase [Sinorhizobium sp. FG01]AUX77961.1 acylphosphatase-like protein [Sinorhizobium fredii]PDT49106.1 acylphosphatase [Sinorhizobium sp. NG07B]POH33256.1 acylphosphatase [Sinorhizobium americanum]POH33822.1 acylphosphatase [Sinorhizobium americanum]
MTERHQSHSRERMTILGDLDAVSFVPWIWRHAAKLGLSQSISHTSPNRIELEVAGPVDLIDMMEIGCSLGPFDVRVETIHRTPVDGGGDQGRDRTLDRPQLYLPLI